MSKRTAWITGFLAVTALAIGGELWAAFDSSANTTPWTELLVRYVPEPVTLGVVAILVAWVPAHFINNYARKAAAMSAPIQPVTATQIKHPWRATARTVLAGLVGVLPLLPEVAAQTHLGTVPTVVQTLAITGAVTRVLAMPAVNGWLGRFAPWLSASPLKP